MVKVMPNSPAAHAGIKAGEVIINFNGTPIYQDTGLINAVQATKPGQKVTVTVWTAKGAKVLHAVVQQMPAQFRVTG